MSNLYIVSTPIGNLQDISIRGAKTILEIPVIIAESTSKAGILLNFLEREFKQKRVTGQKIVSLTEDEEESKIPYLMKMLGEEDAALISEAGTPLISDPGFRLVREAIRQNTQIIPIPGATAAVAAISASGLPTDSFLFLGYPPRTQEKKNKYFSRLNTLLNGSFSPTIIFYESPHRLIETLEGLSNIFGNIDIVLSRELTKIHEEIIRDKTQAIIERLKQKSPKGEFVILFSLKKRKPE